MLSLHYVVDGRLYHQWLTKEFPNGDLLPSVKYLEDEFVSRLKRGETGSGRM